MARWQTPSNTTWQHRMCSCFWFGMLITYIVSAPFRTRWNARFGVVFGSVRDWVGWNDDDDDGLSGRGRATAMGVGGGGGGVGGGGSPKGSDHGVQTVTVSSLSVLSDGVADTQSGVLTPWPEWCASTDVMAVYPNSSEARSTHMADLMRRIGGCAEVVPAVMRDLVTTRARGKRKLAIYEGEVIFSTDSRGVAPRGNLPNAATHFRMLRAFASASVSVPDSSWAVFFEDDAQIHADVAKTYSTPSAISGLLRWSFAEADRLNMTMITYGVCKGSRSQCTVIPHAGDGQHADVELSSCVGDFRCANAYAMPRWRVKAIVRAYDTLNAGADTCPRELVGGSHCGKDPFAFVGYLGQCRGDGGDGGGGGGVQPPCRALAVGTNFVSPTANAKKKDHIGIFIQEKTKDFVKHYAVSRDILS